MPVTNGGVRAAVAVSIFLSLPLAAPDEALGEIGIADNVPAATLLLPWFEVELDGGRTTLLSINNASEDIVLAHVTLWTEWWYPVLGFDVYLTGYDVQTINLFDIVVLGNLPNTGPSNALSSLGDFSAGPHTTFLASCTAAAGSAPNYANLGAVPLQIVQQSLSGQPRSNDGMCTALPGDTNLARGFITIDTVRRCDDEHPSDVGYFVDGGDGTATNDNVLWGDYFLVDAPSNFAQGFTLVHIEADGDSLSVNDGSCDTVDRFPSTFYCTMRNPLAQPGEDNREGLPSAYLTRYVAGGAFTGGTQLLVWRDKLGTGVGAPRDCATTPTPLDQAQIVVFDEQENPLIDPGGGPVIEPLPQETPFPWATNRALIGTDITIDSSFGWLFLNLNAGIAFRQAAVSTVMSSSGRFSVGFDAVAVNSSTLGADNRRGLRQVDPELDEVPNPSAPTLFNGAAP